MDWDLLFAATNVVAVLSWLAVIILPLREKILTFVLWAGVALLCTAYVMMFVALMGGFVDPGRDGPAPAFEYSLEGLEAAFASRGAIAIGWTHYLAFDLFVGLWIARDADGRGVGRIVQLPFLLATFLAGPAGLLWWLLLRGSVSPANRPMFSK